MVSKFIANIIHKVLRESSDSLVDNFIHSVGDIESDQNTNSMGLSSKQEIMVLDKDRTPFLITIEELPKKNKIRYADIWLSGHSSLDESRKPHCNIKYTFDAKSGNLLNAEIIGRER